MEHVRLPRRRRSRRVRIDPALLTIAAATVILATAGAAEAAQRISARPQAEHTSSARSRPLALRPRAVKSTATTITLRWKGSARRTKYGVFVGKERVGSTRKTSFQISRLRCSTTYALGIAR